MSVSGKSSARAHVLVVEDSSVFREMQEILLGQAGYAVSSHENPATALTAAGQQRFDLVVIDYELPGMNGEEFMHALRKIQPEIEIVFVSGALTEELVIRLGTQRLAGIFHKPTNPKTLLEKIDETLARNTARDTAVRIGSGPPLPAGRRGNSNSPVGAGVEASADRLAYQPRFVLGASDTFREFSHRLWKVRDFRAVLLLQGEVGSPFELLARELAEISLFRDGPIMLCEAARFEAHSLIEVLAPSLLSHDAGTLVVSGVETFTPQQQKTLENLITGRDVFLPFARRFRLVLAATSELSERVDEGAFGETLFYKVSALTLTVPTLRDMRSDIVANAQHILARHREAGHVNTPLAIAPDAAEWMRCRRRIGQGTTMNLPARY
jgi:DNA-binding NtrC family response regulator